MNNLIKAEKISLLNNSDTTEIWLQQVIADDPSILGLGDLVLRDKERPQPKAGRLDLLLQDPDTNRRYEVEIQLGRINESHIIRTIEYWDIERKRYPQYDHCAVIIAEDITRRFLNVISLFNGSIPLIAINLSVHKIGDKYLPIFTTVLDEMTLGLIEEDEVKEATNRDYWEKRGTKRLIKIADDLYDMIKTFAPGYELKYNKFYIGLAKDGTPYNFVTFKPKQSACEMDIRLDQSDDIDKMFIKAGIDTLPYDNRNKCYRPRLTKKEISQHKEILLKLMRNAYGLSDKDNDEDTN